jgi:membrane-bound lytic murein transglycosylase B
MARGWFTAALAVAATMLAGGGAQAATCSSTPANFTAWKPQMAAEAKAAGIGSRGLAALMATSYSTGTIRVDRNQHFFHMGLSEFMAKRGATGVIAIGKKKLAQNAVLFASIQRRFGIPPGAVIAIWGMETGFGANTGNQPTISAVATLAYDCRRTDYFTDQLMAALKLVDRGVLSSSTRGAMHGEVGQTQFLPKNILLYGTSGSEGGSINLNSSADALASTAKFLSSQGMTAGNAHSASAFAPWNAATVYQQALAIIAAKIDGQ